ncbi:MAG TPA: AEC family transporter [Bacteroidales bacterium]|nr:AEC family transporter [Bacteroidales bacterium]HQK37383.1 AEC family transporter [Bacteroidales bacterium]
MFQTTFLTVLSAQAKVYLVILLAAVLVRAKVFGKAEVKALTNLIVVLFLPCLIFSNITNTFRPAEIPFWYVLPLAAIALSAFGLGVAWIFFRKELPEKRNLLPIASMQNAGYLALPLGQMLFPLQFEQYALYVFLMILGLSPFLWSVGKMLSTSVHANSSRWPGFVNPPFIANVLAITLVLAKLNGVVPSFVTETVRTLGGATVPLANFALGAIIGGISLRRVPGLKDALRVLSVKFLLMPALMILVVLWTGIGNTNGLLAQTLIIQAASPPATAIMLQINRYGGDEQLAGSLMILSLIVCLPAIPFWLALWNGF